MKPVKKFKRDFQYWRNLGLFTLVICFVSVCFLQFLAIPIISAYGYSHPKRAPVCCYTPKDMGLSYEEIVLKTPENLTLHGWYIPPQNGAVIILLHPLASNRMATLPAAKMLAKHGYGSLLLDLRAHGESDGDFFPYGGPEAEDLQSAISYLLARPEVDNERIGAMGWSLGAQVSILAAAQFSEIKAVIADGPGATAFEDWPPPLTFSERLYVPVDFMFYQAMPFYTNVDEPISIKEAMSQISPRPILLISADFETEKRRIEYFMSVAQEPKSLWVIPGANHIEGINLFPFEYEEKIVNYFNESLLDNKP